ncbi:hypothetical protein RAAC3_TM7C00001G0554 [Candidatus Saccharibacteria bacterium RAAC3_TM7_1]|nr:hypothetical protein RAAC3_TM7C00001G0554 [Candidatus Saccharibacteria bacterium RAAC3_TM7_1]
MSMSIEAIQTSERKITEWLSGETQIHHAVAADLGTTATHGEVIAFPGSEKALGQGRIEPEHSFENVLEIRAEVGELDKLIVGLQQELAAAHERAEALREQLDDLGGFVQTDEEQGQSTVREATVRLRATVADISMLVQAIKAKETAKAKFMEWQEQVELGLEAVGDPRFLDLRERELTRAYSAGSLSRADGTIAERRP